MITTLPHFVAAWLVAATHPWYAALIAAYSTTAVLSYEPIQRRLLLLWSIIDIWMWPPSFIFNGILVVLYPGLIPPPPHPLYDAATMEILTYSEWNMLSAAKAIFIAWILR